MLHCFFPDAEVCSVSFHGCCGGAATMEACPHLDGGVVQECSGGPCQVVRIGNIGDIVSGFWWFYSNVLFGLNYSCRCWCHPYYDYWCHPRHVRHIPILLIVVTSIPFAEKALIVCSKIPMSIVYLGEYFTWYKENLESCHLNWLKRIY